MSREAVTLSACFPVLPFPLVRLFPSLLFYSILFPSLPFLSFPSLPFSLLPWWLCSLCGSNFLGALRSKGTATQVEEGRSAALYSQRRRASSPSLAGWYLSPRVSGPVRDHSTQTGPDPAVAGTYLLACSATGPTTDLPAQKKILPPPPPAPHRRLWVSQKRSQSCFSFVPLVFFGQLCRWFSRLSLITFPELFLLCSPRFLRVVVGPAAFCTRAHEASSGKRGTYTPFFRWVGGCVAGWLGSGFLFWVEGWRGAGRWGLVCV